MHVCILPVLTHARTIKPLHQCHTHTHTHTHTPHRHTHTHTHLTGTHTHTHTHTHLAGTLPKTHQVNAKAHRDLRPPLLLDYDRCHLFYGWIGRHKVIKRRPIWLHIGCKCMCVCVYVWVCVKLCVLLINNYAGVKV